MKIDLKEKLKELNGTSIDMITNEKESLSIEYSSGAKVETSYWRLLTNEIRISRFDHLQKYGLAETIDAVGIIKKTLIGKQVLSADFDNKSGDIRLIFDKQMTLEIFNFTGCEVWEIEFADGSGQLSNYV